MLGLLQIRKQLFVPSVDRSVFRYAAARPAQGNIVDSDRRRLDGTRWTMNFSQKDSFHLRARRAYSRKIKLAKTAEGYLEHRS